MQLFLQNVQNEIFKILKKFKYNLNFTRGACWINSQKSNSDKKNHSWYSYFVTIVGHYYDVVVEGL